MTKPAPSASAAGRVHCGKASGTSGGRNGVTGDSAAAPNNATLPLVSGATIPPSAGIAGAAGFAEGITDVGTEPAATLYEKICPPPCASVQTSVWPSADATGLSRTDEFLTLGENIASAISPALKASPLAAYNRPSAVSAVTALLASV